MRFVIMAAAVLIAEGCSSPASRIESNPAAVAGLDAATQARLRRGEIAVGDGEDLVRVAMGQPLRTHELPGGGIEWLYRDRPRDPNDYVAAGFRHRVEFDPVQRGNITIIEPVDDRLYPQLRTHTIRVAFLNGRVTGVTSQEDP